MKSVYYLVHFDAYITNGTPNAKKTRCELTTSNNEWIKNIAKYKYVPGEQYAKAFSFRLARTSSFFACNIYLSTQYLVKSNCFFLVVFSLLLIQVLRLQMLLQTHIWQKLNPHRFFPFAIQIRIPSLSYRFPGWNRVKTQHLFNKSTTWRWVCANRRYK